MSLLNHGTKLFSSKICFTLVKPGLEKLQCLHIWFSVYCSPLDITPKHRNLFIHSYTYCVISLHKQQFLKRLFPQRSMVRLDNYVSLQSWNMFCNFMSIQALTYISISPTMVFCVLFQLCFWGTGWVLSCFKVNYLCILERNNFFLNCPYL